jgi:hypothetical protein
MIRTSKNEESEKVFQTPAVGSVTLRDVYKLAEQNRQQTHNITNSNLSINSEDQFQMQSKAQLQYNRQLIKML